MKNKFLMTTAAAVLSLGVLAACGDAEQEPGVDNEPIENPALDDGAEDGVEGGLDDGTEEDGLDDGGIEDGLDDGAEDG